MTICGVPFMNSATGSPSITCLIFPLRSLMRVPFVLIRSSWMVPSASGAASASLTSRCWSSSESPANRGVATVTWKWSPRARPVLDGELGRVGERLRQQLAQRLGRHRPESSWLTGVADTDRYTAGEGLVHDAVALRQLQQRRELFLRGGRVELEREADRAEADRRVAVDAHRPAEVEIAFGDDAARRPPGRD